MTTARVHPELMSKQVLIQRVRDMAETAEKWRRLYVLERYAANVNGRPWQERPVEVVLSDAHELLAALGPDPDAVQHREDLEAALDDDTIPARCWRANCEDELDGDGRCPRHDWHLQGRKPKGSKE